MSWHIRRTARRVEQVQRVGRLIGAGEDFSAIVDYALAYVLASQGGDAVRDQATDEAEDIEKHTE